MGTRDGNIEVTTGCLEKGKQAAGDLNPVYVLFIIRER